MVIDLDFEHVDLLLRVALFREDLGDGIFAASAFLLVIQQDSTSLPAFLE